MLFLKKLHICKYMIPKFFWITPYYRVNINLIFSLEDQIKPNPYYEDWVTSYEQYIDDIRNSELERNNVIEFAKNVLHDENYMSYNIDQNYNDDQSYDGDQNNYDEYMEIYMNNLEGNEDPADFDNNIDDQSIEQPNNIDNDQLIAEIEHTQMLTDNIENNIELTEDIIDQYITYHIGEPQDPETHTYYIILQNGMKVETSKMKYDLINEIIDKYAV